MTVLCLDSFASIGALSANWNTPAPGGALVSAFTADGQVARTGATTTASTVIWAHLYNSNPGVWAGKYSVEAKRLTSNVKAVGVVARAALDTANRERYFFGFSNETGTDVFCLRLYTSHTAYSTVGTVNVSATSFTAGDLLTHTYAITFSATGNLINMTCSVDGINVLVANNQTNFLTALSAAGYRAVGMQAVSGATWTAATDYAQFDNAKFDDLATPTLTAAPSLVSTATLSADSIATETNGSSVDDLALDPDFGEIQSEIWETNNQETDAGYDVKFPGVTVGRRRWRLRWTSATWAQLEPLLLQVAADGAPRFILYTDAAGSTHTTTYVGNSMRWEQVAQDVFNAEAELEELLS